MLGISRQAHFKCLKYDKTLAVEQAVLLEEVKLVRRDHPRMGMAKLYDLLQPELIGRDRFIKLLKVNGLQLNKVRNYSRTTYSIAHLAYDNKIKNLVVDRLNQLWVSDITYFYALDRHYYLTFIMDVYSRYIVGYAASDSLAATANVRALKMALRNRKGQSLQCMIHHSDRGSQYIYHQYIELLKRNGVQISMGNKAWENAHAERINRTIKNDYLYPKGPITGLKSLQKKLAKQVYLYNHQRPHQELPQRLAPFVFEQLAAQKQMDYKVKINY
jgi:transposase InsO family protein